MSSPKDNPAVKLRVDMVNGNFELDQESLDFMKLVREKIAEVAETLRERSPDHCDVGRLIAAIDKLQEAKNTFCDAAILGNEKENRIKRQRV